MLDLYGVISGNVINETRSDRLLLGNILLVMTFWLVLREEI
jgi:hypothetical protein